MSHQSSSPQSTTQLSSDSSPSLLAQRLETELVQERLEGTLAALALPLVCERPERLTISRSSVSAHTGQALSVLLSRTARGTEERTCVPPSPSLV